MAYTPKFVKQIEENRNARWALWGGVVLSVAILAVIGSFLLGGAGFTLISTAVIFIALSSASIWAQKKLNSGYKSQYTAVNWFLKGLARITPKSTLGKVILILFTIAIAIVVGFFTFGAGAIPALIPLTGLLALAIPSSFWVAVVGFFAESRLADIVVFGSDGIVSIWNKIFGKDEAKKSEYEYVEAEEIELQKVDENKDNLNSEKDSPEQAHASNQQITGTQNQEATINDPENVLHQDPLLQQQMLEELNQRMTELRERQNDQAYDPENTIDSKSSTMVHSKVYTPESFPQEEHGQSEKTEKPEEHKDITTAKPSQESPAKQPATATTEQKLITEKPTQSEHTTPTLKKE